MNTSGLCEEPEDINLLARHVLIQAIEDYCHLQSPMSRRKRYVHQAWLSAISMFFDEDFLFDSFTDETGEPLDLHDFLLLATDRENVSIDALHEHLIASSHKYWKAQQWNIMIPDTITILGLPWEIQDSETVGINHATRTICLNKKTGQRDLIRFVIEAICDQKEIVIPVAKLLPIADAFSQVLQVNACFQEIPKETRKSSAEAPVETVLQPRRPRGRPPRVKPDPDTQIQEYTTEDEVEESTVEE